MKTLLDDIVNHNIQGRNVAIIENGSWAPTSGKQIKEEVAKLKNINLLNEEHFSIRSTLKDAQVDALDALAEAIAATVL